ncbi:MAG: hypothetical protein AAF927_08735 [Bacteroidota bacterium]
MGKLLNNKELFVRCIKCYDCGAKGQMSVDGFVKSIYLSYIPLFPIWAWQELRCVRCNANLKFSEMGPELKEKYKPYRRFLLPMPWHFSGLIIVLGIFLWGKHSQAKEQQIILERAQNLQIKRVIEYREGPKAYTSMKVCGFEGEYLLVRYNRYQVQSQKGLERILMPENYAPDTLYFHRDSLMQMIEDKEVVAISW